MRKLLAALAIYVGLLSASPAQNVLFPANPGDMIYRGPTAWNAVPGGSVGCVLMSNGSTSAPTWQCALPLNFLLPPMATNRVWGNVSGTQAPASQISVNQFLDTIGYDTLRTPTNGSIPYKDPSSGTWQALTPSVNAGWVLSSAGALQTPVWAFPGNTAVPGAAGTCLVSNGVSPAVPSYQSCLTALASTMTNGQLLVGQTSALPLPKTVNGDGTLDLNAAFTLATVNGNVGAFGSATAVPVITVNAKGLITAVTTAAPTVTSVNGVAYPVSGTTGDLLQATAAATMGRLAAVATGNALISGGVGTLSTWGKIGLATHVSGNLPVTNLNSGTGASSSTFWRGDGTWTTPAGGGTVTSAVIAGTANNVTATGTCTITTTGTCTLDLAAARKTLPTTQAFTTGTNLTYTLPANALWIEGFLFGDGGGGGGGGAGGGGGSNGSGTCWKASGTACTTPLYAAGGGGAAGASGASGGTGGTVSGSATCNASGNGAVGQGFGAGGATLPGAMGGGASHIGLPGYGGAPNNNAGNSGPANSGAGGGGGSTSVSLIGNGGGGGAWCYFIINSPAATYVYTIGPGGGGGTAGTSGGAGGAGALGYIYVVEHYNYLLKRDLAPANDNTPAFLNAAA